MSLLQGYCLSPQVNDLMLDCIRLGDIHEAKKKAFEIALECSQIFNGLID